MQVSYFLYFNMLTDKLQNDYIVYNRSKDF